MSGVCFSHIFTILVGTEDGDGDGDGVDWRRGGVECMITSSRGVYKATEQMKVGLPYFPIHRDSHVYLNSSYTSCLSRLSERTIFQM